MNKKIAVALILACIAVKNCNAIELDFDGSGKIAGRTIPLLNNSSVISEIAEPMPALAKGVNEPLEYLLPRDSNDQLYMSEQAVNQAGASVSDSFRAAGYLVLSGRAQRNPWGCSPTDYCSNGWVFWLNYTAPDGQIAWKPQKYAFLRDSNANVYTSEAALLNDAKLAESKLTEAGYTFLRRTVRRLAPYTTGGPTTWDCEIEFIAPAGSAPGNIQLFQHNTDQQGNWYSGPQGRMRAIAGGKGVADNLRAAGYIILEEYAFPFDAYSKWEYDIWYIARIK